MSVASVFGAYPLGRNEPTHVRTGLLQGALRTGHFTSGRLCLRGPVILLNALDADRTSECSEQMFWHEGDVLKAPVNWAPGTPSKRMAMGKQELLGSVTDFERAPPSNQMEKRAPLVWASVLCACFRFKGKEIYTAQAP